MKLATIGYEGLSQDEVFSMLHANNISILIDVRELPLSRKPGFSKGALQKRATSDRLIYSHIPALGCPRSIRYDYRDDHDWDKYTQRYLSYLLTQEQEIEKLLHLVITASSCILCFEANPYRCHRYYVANRVARLAGAQLTIIHLVGKERPVVSPPPLEGILIRQ